MHCKFRIIFIGLLVSFVGEFIFANSNQLPNKQIVNQSVPIDLKINFDVVKFKLDNGLTVLLHEDHSVPMISYHTWFKVGSQNEYPGITGVSHMLEHMAFKGTENFRSGSFSETFKKNGIHDNAFTSRDYTGYHSTFPSDKLSLVVKMEADRLKGLVFSEDDFLSEREVVKEERRSRVDNNPQGLLYEVLFSTVFRVHSYRWPVIGWMKDIESYTVDKIKNYWNDFYSPSNAVLVIVGDFKQESLRSLIQNQYNVIPKREVKTTRVIKEPEQKGQRNASLVRNVQSAYFVMGYQTPKSGSDEAYALDLLANLLGYGESSRLYKRLVYKEQKVNSAFSYNMSFKDNGIFFVGVNVKSGVEVDKVIPGVFSEVWSFRAKKITEKELEKAKNQVMKSYVDGLTTIDGKATAFAINEIYHDSYKVLFSDLDRYHQVTIEQIQQVAEKYLHPSRRTIVRLNPKSSSGGQ